VEDLASGLTVRKALARVLTDAGHSDRKVAEVVGLHRETVAKVRRDQYALPPGMIEALRDYEASKLTIVAHKAIDELLENPEKIEKASALQLVTVAGIAIDKRQLLAGEPTDIVKHLSNDDLDEEISKLRRQVGYSKIPEAEVSHE